MTRLLVLIIFVAGFSHEGNAQRYVRNGYATYPNYYGGYYRAPYYGGGMRQSCGYYGCYAQHQYSPPVRRYQYDWSWGGGNRGYLGGRGGGWGGEW